MTPSEICGKCSFGFLQENHCNCSNRHFTIKCWRTAPYFIYCHLNGCPWRTVPDAFWPVKNFKFEPTVWSNTLHIWGTKLTCPFLLLTLCMRLGNTVISHFVFCCCCCCSPTAVHLKAAGIWTPTQKTPNSCRSLSYTFLIFGIPELTEQWVRFGPLIAPDQSRVDVKYSFISKWSFQQRWKTYAYYLESRLKTSKEELPLQSEHSYAIAFEHVTSSFSKYKTKWLP